MSIFKRTTFYSILFFLLFPQISWGQGGNPCGSFPCANGGACSTIASGGFVCSCRPFTSGFTCQDTVYPQVWGLNAPVVNKNDTNVAINGIYLSPTENVEVLTTYTITDGTLAIGTANITFGGSGNESASFTAVGTMVNLNLALDAATFTPTPNLSGINVAGIQIQVKYGSFIDTASVTFNILDTPTVQVNGKAGWRMMGVPITGVTVGDLAGINLVQGVTGLPFDTDDPNFYLWDPLADTPDYDVPANGLTDLPPGTGFIWYLYGPEANPDISESKPFPLTVQLTGNEAAGDVSLGTLAADWHLIANPLIEDIKFDLLTDGSGAALNVAGQVWDPNAGSEGSYELTTGGTLSNILPAWQGAFINLTSSAEIVIPQSAKTTGGTFLKEQFLPLAGQVEFLLEGESNGEPIVDKAAILYFSERAGEAWDGYDVPKLTPFSGSWATVNLVGDRDGERVYKSQHSLPYDFTGTQEIPVDIQLQKASGDFTLSWPVVSNLPLAELWLVDRQTGERYDLSRPGHIDFTMEATAKQAAATAETSVLKLPKPEPMRFKQSSEPRFVIQVNLEAVCEELPEAFTLNQNYPNPFNPTTIISYELPQAANVRLEVYDMAGRQVAMLVNEQVAAGRHTVSFNAGSLSSGVYMYRLQTERGVFTRKLTLIK
jgi:hypothetical protein